MKNIAFKYNIFSDLSTLNWTEMKVDGRIGVNIVEVFFDKVNDHQGSRLAILNYEPGAHVPSHIHTGFEMILMISGELIDDFGTYYHGDIIIYNPDSQHGLFTNSGCTFLVLWDKPVVVGTGDLVNEKE